MKKVLFVLLFMACGKGDTVIYEPVEKIENPTQVCVLSTQGTGSWQSSGDCDISYVDGDGFLITWDQEITSWSWGLSQSLSQEGLSVAATVSGFDMDMDLMVDLTFDLVSNPLLVDVSGEVFLMAL